jgi:hypothetical protein
MNRRTIDRKRDAAPASANVSRLLVLGFLIAALLGLVVGIGWVAWNLVAAR